MSIIENKINGAEYTVESELEFILHMLGVFYEVANFGQRQEILVELKKLEESTFDHVSHFRKMLSDEEAEFRKPETEEHIGDSIQLMVIYASLAHCAEARRLDCGRDKRWWHVASARTYLGYLRGTITGQEMGARAATRVRATKGATVRHKENREMKKEAFDWLSKNMERFRSKDAAAEAIAGAVVPIKFRTARDWIDQWEQARSREQE